MCLVPCLVARCTLCIIVHCVHIVEDSSYIKSIVLFHVIAHTLDVYIASFSGVVPDRVILIEEKSSGKLEYNYQS